MKALPEFAVRRPTIVVSIVLMTVVWGIVSFLTMPRREDPEFTIKTCVVSTQWPGAPTTKVEELITDPLEEAIDGLQEVKQIRSTSAFGLSTIFVELDESIPASRVDDIWDKVRARIEVVRMPESGIRPVVNDQFGDTSVILFAIHQLPGEDKATEATTRYSARQLDQYSEIVRDSLRLLPGVARVDRYGVQEEAIYVETDSGTWSQLELTSEQLAQLIQARNIVAPGGSIEGDDGRFFVKPGGEFDGVKEIRSIIADVARNQNSLNQVYLRDLNLTVRRGYTDPPGLLCRYADPDESGPAVIVGVTMKSGSNIIEICDASRETVTNLQTRRGLLPPDLEVSIISDQSVSVRQRIRDVLINIGEAILIVVVFVYLFVGFRTAAVMAANIPFVVLASLGIVTLLDVQLEQMSLASMIIALGLLVDNAVQVCDQALTNQKKGMPPAEAAVRGAQLLGTSMLNGTLTTIAAFVPMLIAIDGANREFIYSLPVTLSVMLIVSWVLAMTFCVLLAAAFIRVPDDPNAPTAPIPRLLAALRNLARRRRKPSKPDHADASREPAGLYAAISMLCLRWKFLTVTAGFAALVAVTQLDVASEFFPLTERNQFAVEITLPESATIEQTLDVAKQVEEAIQKLSPATDEEGRTVERLANLRTLVGGGGSRWYLSWDPESRKPNYAEILIRTTHGRWTHSLAEDLRRVTRTGNAELKIAPVSGARIVPVELALGPPADPVVLRVSGEGFADEQKLRSIAEQVRGMVADHPQTWADSDSWGIPGYELQVQTRTDVANLSGVTNAAVAATLNSYFTGRLMTTFREGDHQVPVYFRLRPDRRQSLSDLRDAWIEGQSGKIPLTAIADLQPGWEPSRIERRDGNRTIQISSRILPDASGNDVTNEIYNSDEMQSLIASLPNGYHVRIGGALEESQEVQGKMLMSFLLSLLAVVLLLILQFNSIPRMIIIVSTLPLALIGAILGLWITDNALGFMPQLGILSLFGIVLNAGIIFMEFADIVVREHSSGTTDDRGLTAAELRLALTSAGQQRLMPIFLTTATTVGGLIPLAVAGGPLWTGMAWLMVYGLVVATILTLLIIPAMYAIAYQTFGLLRFESSDQPAAS